MNGGVPEKRRYMYSPGVSATQSISSAPARAQSEMIAGSCISQLRWAFRLWLYLGLLNQQVGSLIAMWTSNDFWLLTLRAVLAMAMRGRFATRIAAWLSLVPREFGQSFRDFDSRAESRLHKFLNSCWFVGVP